MKFNDSCAKCMYDRQAKKTDNKEYLAKIRDILDNRSPDVTSSQLVVEINKVMNVDAPMLHMNGIGAGEPYVAVDAAARVPARVGLVAVVNADGHHVAAFTDVGRDVVLEAGVAVGAVAHLLPVHVDRRVHIHAVELQEHFFLCAVTR